MEMSQKLQLTAGVTSIESSVLSMLRHRYSAAEHSEHPETPIKYGKMCRLCLTSTGLHGNGWLSHRKRRRLRATSYHSAHNNTICRLPEQ